MSDEWLVVGLGNPEAEYGGTRHNIGADAVRALAARHRQSFTRNKKTRCAEAKVRLGDARLTLVLPESYMNTLGGHVQAAAAYVGAPADHVIALHDELDLDLGQLRVKLGGSSSHNGIRDIVRALGTKDVLRVRIGIGRPPGRMPGKDFVLRRFSAAERVDADIAAQEAADAVEHLVQQGLEPTQNRFHAPRKELS